MGVRSLPAFNLVPVPLSEEAEAMLSRPSYVDESIGERHRLGGAPDRWSEASSSPRCPFNGGMLIAVDMRDPLGRRPTELDNLTHS